MEYWLIFGGVLALIFLIVCICAGGDNNSGDSGGGSSSSSGWFGMTYDGGIGYRISDNFGIDLGDGGVKPMF